MLLLNIQIILSSKKIQLLQKLLFNNVIVKESVNKKMIRNSVYITTGNSHSPPSFYIFQPNFCTLIPK